VKKRSFYGLLASATLVATYLVIVAGSLVRAAGAGMGCPDWPRCFGKWVPPMTVSEVPAEFVQWFNVRLAWIEYLNRLVGVILGFLVAGTLFFAWREHRAQKAVVRGSALAFFFVGLAGWLGKRVVEQNLDPAFVTVHMFVALMVVASLVYAIVYAQSSHGEMTSSRLELRGYSIALTGLTLIQVALGTRVRATIEHAVFGPAIALSTGHARPATARFTRDLWIAQAGSSDTLHRSLALVVVSGAIFLAWRTMRVEQDRVLRALALTIAAGCITQLSVGVGLVWLRLPPGLQIAHVTFGSMIFGAMLAFGLLLGRQRHGA
jgi:cytochrome c oxidase assembly protein subunit 15